ncbi:hypothetical protein [Natronosalvus amylolyticus]|uniref:hypothetical protein n=1 Tax=Natronosalvus amylolyticus TaxID=2961994 RepID=UPI0020CA1D16|nr:hypothetical protein [Natronosalvus amylolyticus]
MTDEPDSQGITDILSFRWFGALLVALLVGVVSGASIISIHTSTPYLDVMNVVGALASISLSAVLAYLYLRMSDIQGQQKSIMTQQQKIMEAEHLPHLYLQNIEIEQEKMPISVSKKIADSKLGFELGEMGEFNVDVVELSLHNVGNGLAKDLRLEVEVEGNSEQSLTLFSQEAIGKPMSEYRHNNKALREKEMQRDTDQNHRDFIESKKSGKFWVRPLFFVWTYEDVVEVPFSFLSKLYSQQDVDEIYVKIGLSYKDMAGKRHYGDIDEKTIPMNEIGRGEGLAAVVEKKDIVTNSDSSDPEMENVFHPRGFYIDNVPSDWPQVEPDTLG